ncbi:MAG: type II toxin-antitoxin system VapC family toxin [Coriobacteriales bacterium]|jgi:tRNA(fMet)-specific endonuclease VapC|nr:type II toxin-antitoxin system VapC family toxin [Coriobacteriales bacterium]
MRRYEYLLDTDVCINIIRSKEDSILRRTCAEELEQISISSIAVAELEFGVVKSANPKQNYLALTKILSPMRIRPFDQRAAREYGKLRIALEEQGKRIGQMDMLIAAQALADNLVLVTNNYREFGRIEGLSAESWYELDYSDRMP